MKKLLLAVALIAILSGCISSNTQKACTEEAKLCPDGTYVVRIAPDCEFAPCPCTCPEGYRKEGDSCNPECYYSNPPCLAPSIPCSTS